MGEKAALVTGAGIRLGKSFALFLAQQGYDIALHYNNSQQEATATSEEVRKHGVQCEIFQADFQNIQSVEELSNKVIQRFNIKVVINSASVYHQATILNTSAEIFDAHFNIHIKAPFFLSRSFALYGEIENIINILDNKIGFHQFQYAAYLLSKKALAEFTHLAALEFAPRIRVNAIAPGVILPPDSRTQEYQEWRIQDIPLKNKGDTRHIHQALQYILTNDFVNGQILTVDGGESIAHVGKNIETYTRPQ